MDTSKAYSVLNVCSPAMAGDAKRPKLAITDMYPTDSVQTLKRTIAREIKRPEVWTQLQLFYLGTELTNEQTLGSYDIRDGESIIQTASIDTQRPTQINQSSDQNEEKPNEFEVKYEGPLLKSVFIKEMQGKTSTLHNVAIGMPIDDFLAKVALEKGIDTKFIRLIYAGKQLEGHSRLKLSDYGLQNDCTLHLVIRIPGGKSS